MSPRSSVCRRIEQDLVAVASGEDGGAAERVRAHVPECGSCRGALERYRLIEREVRDLRAAQDARAAADTAGVAACLAGLRQRLLRYGVFDSPLGRILIGRTEEGVSLIRYLDGTERDPVTRLARAAGLEPVEDGSELERLAQELLEYLTGDRRRLEWRLDLRLARSDFHLRVLRATAALPWGAVTSYAHIAQDVGNPAGVRAVAQALRWNPLPIVVPCHRVVGASGSLTGYAGDRLGLKQRLLAVEHVPTRQAGRDLRVSREAMYVRDPGGREYCLPTCGSLSTMTLARLVLFASRDIAERTGLAPCGTCRPDLHPLSN
jgi:methylated-DNA-[protein]-cysteine S-methyltransferase